MKRLVPSLLLVTVLLAPSLCEAQVSVKFKKLEINNITNKRSEPVTVRSGEVFLSNVPNVMLKITAEIINDGDTTVYWHSDVEQMEFEPMKFLYYDSQYGWRKIDHLSRQVQFGIPYLPGVEPHSRKQITYYYSYNDALFYKVSSLYYVSSTVPTMRLLLSIPGQEPIFSEAPETIYVNGVRLDSDEQECQDGGSYQLVNNEMMQEYMRENSYLFGSEFSQDILIREFQSNMAYSQRQYSLLRLPETSVVLKHP